MILLNGRLLSSFFCLTFTGLYDEENPLLAIFSSFVSVTRYFIESMVVQDARCLPQQTGYTIHDLTTTLPPQVNSFALIPVAQHDRSVVHRSCDGWYWSFWPALFVGLTIRFLAAGALHVCDRSKQAKHSFRDELRTVKPIHRNPACWSLGIFLICLLGLFVLSIVLIQIERGSNGLIDPERYLNATNQERLELIIERFMDR